MIFKSTAIYTPHFCCQKNITFYVYGLNMSGRNAANNFQQTIQNRFFRGKQRPIRGLSDICALCRVYPTEVLGKCQQRNKESV